MVFLPSDDRAFILDKNGYIYITEPEKQGFPMEVYMYLPSTYSKEEVGLISILPSQEWAAGDKTFYLYWGHKDRNTAGMRISKFSHSENDGGLSSRGIASSETLYGIQSKHVKTSRRPQFSPPPAHHDTGEVGYQSAASS